MRHVFSSSFFSFSMCVSQSVNSTEPFKWPLVHFSCQIILWATIWKWEQTTKSMAIIRFAIQWKIHTYSTCHCMRYMMLMCIIAQTFEISVWTTNNNHINWMSRREPITFRVKKFCTRRSYTHAHENAAPVSLIIISFSQIYFSFNFIYLLPSFILSNKVAAYLFIPCRRRASNIYCCEFFIVFGLWCVCVCDGIACVWVVGQATDVFINGCHIVLLFVRVLWHW